MVKANNTKWKSPKHMFTFQAGSSHKVLQAFSSHFMKEQTMADGSKSPLSLQYRTKHKLTINYRLSFHDPTLPLSSFRDKRSLGVKMIVISLPTIRILGRQKWSGSRLNCDELRSRNMKIKL